MRKVCNGLLTLLLFPLFLSVKPARADYTATVDAGRRYQTFEGWGTSLAWWANVVGGFPEPYRSDYINKVFDLKLGLGLTVVRYNIGGGEAPGKHYLHLRESVQGFEPSPGQWDWNADANQRYVLFAGIKKGVNQFEAFSNSPPYWMTKSGSVTGAAGGGDNLDPKYNDAFADYLTEVVRHYHDQWGLTFRTLEPVNEPDSGWWTLGRSQEGCHFGHAAQNAIVRAVGASLAAKHSGTTVSSPDDNSIDEAVGTFTSYDATAKAAISQINTHSYSGQKRSQLNELARSSGKRLWMSEYGDGNPSGMTLSERILSDMRVLRPTAWVYWQAVDSNGWGLMVNREDGAPHFDYTINQKYYVLANYSKFIRPGDTIVDIDDTHSLAAYNAAAGKLVIVTTNNTADTVNVAFDVSRFGVPPKSVTAYRTSATEQLAPLPQIAVIGGRFTTAAPPHSVTTFVLTGARKPFPTTRPQFDANAVYQLVNAGTGQCLAVSNAGGLVRTASDADIAEQWNLVESDGGYYEIRNRKSGTVLDVSQASTASGANVLAYAENDGPNQQWKIAPAGKEFTVTNRNSGLALAVSPDGLHQETLSGAETQRWRLVRVKSSR